MLRAGREARHRLGDRSWGQVRGFPRRLKVLRGKVDASAEPCELQGKRSTKPPSQPTYRATAASMVREGVDVSSPSEGSSDQKNRKWAVFVAVLDTAEHLPEQEGLCSDAITEVAQMA
jgi:hypothetical protein